MRGSVVPKGVRVVVLAPSRRMDRKITEYVCVDAK